MFGEASGIQCLARRKHSTVFQAFRRLYGAMRSDMEGRGGYSHASDSQQRGDCRDAKISPAGCGIRK